MRSLYVGLFGRREKSVLSGHTDRVQSVAVSADGSRVVTGSDDGTARLWGAGWPKGNILEIACSLLRDKSLDSVSQDYSLVIDDPICVEGVAIPDPDWGRVERAVAK